MKELYKWIDWANFKIRDLDKEESKIFEEAIEITKRIIESEKEKEVWAWVDGEQHYFVPEEVGQWFQARYDGNISLCKKKGIKDDNDRYLSTSQIEETKLDESKKVCKRCLELYNIREKKTQND